ncbi:Rieske 2Fe-2S domain-containing protein [Mycobacteroides abscessus]
MSEQELVWHKAVDQDALVEGEVTVCPVGLKSVALTKLHGRFGAIDNRCPHQGGPLGQGALENDKIRCPWHGFDFDPFTGEAAGGPDFDVLTYPVDVREDGVYVGTPPPAPHVRTVSDVLIETMTNWGVDTVFGMVGTRISVSPRRCTGPKATANCGTSASGTRARRPSPPRHTGS